MPKFKFAGHDVSVRVKELPVEAESDLKASIIKDAYGNVNEDATAEVMKQGTLRRGLESIKIDGKTHDLRPKKEGFKLPALRDPDTYENMSEELVRCVVGHDGNEWLGKIAPLKDFFAEYLPDDEDDENPTASEATTTEGTSGVLRSFPSETQTSQEHQSPSAISS